MQTTERKSTATRRRGEVLRAVDWLLPAVVVSVAGLIWLVALRYDDAMEKALVTSYRDTQLEIVRSVARGIHGVAGDLPKAGADIPAIEQEEFRRLVAPVRLLRSGDAWIYTPDYVVFDESSDFPEIYRGKSMSEIFASQKNHGARDYEVMTEAASRATEGVGSHVWLPDKGREIAAWTPVRLEGHVRTIGLSTPVKEIFAATGFQRHRRFTFGVCILATAAALLLATVSVVSTAKTRRFNRMLQSRNEERQGVVHELQREMSLRERSESEARAVSVRLNALVEAVPDLIYFKDSNGRHQIVNRAFEAFCRHPRKKILDRTDSELFPHRNIDGFIASDRRVLKEGKVLRTEQETDAESGVSRWFDTVKAPIADADGQVTGVVGVSRDVTDLKAAEADRSRLADRLMHAQKMEAIGTLAGGVPTTSTTFCQGSSATRNC
jgi:PAS domain S-box-containing protein